MLDLGQSGNRRRQGDHLPALGGTQLREGLEDGPAVGRCLVDKRQQTLPAAGFGVLTLIVKGHACRPRAIAPDAFAAVPVRLFAGRSGSIGEPVGK